MYQRFGLVDVVVSVAVSFIVYEPSGSDAEHKCNGNADKLIRKQEKNGRDSDHDICARRPCDLRVSSQTSLLQKVEQPTLWCSIAHVLAFSIQCPVRLAGAEAVEDSNLQPPVLETGALAIELHSSVKAYGDAFRVAAAMSCINAMYNA